LDKLKNIVTNNPIIILLLFAAYLLVDFLIFKHFIYNKKGLIQIIMEKIKSGKKLAYKKQ